jgi:hypothetical protein
MCKWINKNFLKFLEVIVRLVGVLSHFIYLEDARNHKLKIHHKFYLSNLEVYRKLRLDQDANHSTTAMMR